MGCYLGFLHLTSQEKRNNSAFLRPVLSPIFLACQLLREGSTLVTCLLQRMQRDPFKTREWLCDQMLKHEARQKTTSTTAGRESWTGRRARRSLTIYLTAPRAELKLHSTDPKRRLLKRKHIARGAVKAHRVLASPPMESSALDR